ncbi:MAG: HAD family hydrolase [Chloroflexi bacterium HGW-Chloroflexi-9]|nr:MAG: HAD family hydrolase [Chloroflexi bacterium HGW-Chloroflexi-9]
MRAVIFDWGGTLSDWALVEFDEIWRMAAEHLAPHLGEPAEALRRRLSQVETDAWAATASDHASFTFLDLVRRASDALGANVADALLEEATEHYLDAWLPHIVHDPEAAETLSALRDHGLRIGLLSNTHWPAEFHERMLERDGLAHLIDARLYTSEMPFMKPHPDAFRAALAGVGIEDAREAVFVGDRLFDDVYGAQSVGMRAIHRPNVSVPSHEARPDAVIQRLSELPAIIDRWR